MNASQNSENPYDAGSPVSGKNFYGRSKELGEVLEGTKKFIWFISTRRMGKTSLLNQISNLCQEEDKYNEKYRCLFWNLQGISEPDFERLYKKLTLRTNQPYIPEIDLMSLDSNQSCAQVIESCIEAVSEEGLTLLLLIDEPDVFLTLAEKGEIEFLDELLDCLQLQGIRTVIASTFMLDRLAPLNPLLDQFERFFISPFDPEEGKALICQTNVLNPLPPFVHDKQVITEILNKANYSPFFIQKICEYLYPDKDITDKQIWDKIFDLRVFDAYFESDFSGLNDAEKAILCFMIGEEEKDIPASEIITGAKEFSARPIPIHNNLEVMTSLNILRHKNDNYYLANPVFRRWLNNRCMDNPFRINVEDVEVLTSK
jgi:AAA+ ATPase superfamily predicted ATPase